MKLFLTSAACNVLDEFVKLLDRPPEELTVAFIPTAADQYDDAYFVDNDRSKLVGLGFKIKDVSITDISESALREQLENIDIIFVAGGNVFYLLEKVLASGFNTIIKQLDVWYIGSSAGSVIAGSTIEPFKSMDDPDAAPNLMSYDGLGLLDNIILPHYGNEKYQHQINTILHDYADVLTLKDNQAIIVIDKKLRIISQD